ncbi:ferritin-like domain-containing protein [Nodularia sp. UHCC 0506]|uniref:ferritin-like domain-containing protein n=1 Tax=Nodularia sp. UHCC 0506 TaxID=3110243 RepID=UPI002B2161F3|nr:ferritin-like domain-containing protein [Nodularia sp. UHCC 0506]MEA5517261.1 ferritin-like domain-containing protein [Nodularia sp. UHCC 0506]
MNLITYIMYLASSGATAYYTSSQIRDPKTRLNVLAGLQKSEASSVKFLSALSERAFNEGDNWLAEKLKKHASDEVRHSQIFAHALKQIDNRTKDITSTEKQPTESTQHQGTPFFALYFHGYSQEDLQPAVIDWNVFAASTYILEIDAGKDFKRMANVLPDNEQSSRNLKQGLLNIAQDETGHAAYLYEAMMRQMPPIKVQNLVDEWRTRKVDAIFKLASEIFQGVK